MNSISKAIAAGAGAGAVFLPEGSRWYAYALAAVAICAGLYTIYTLI